MSLEQRLRASEERHEAIFKSALDCVITMDHTGRIIDFNPAAERVFGYGREEAAGQILAELIIPPDLRESHRRSLTRYLEEGEATILDRRLELEAIRRDGATFPIELTVTRLGSAEPPEFVGFVRDISDRRTTDTEHERLLTDAIATRALAQAAQERSEIAQQLAEQSERRLALLAQVGERLLAAQDEGGIIDAAIAAVVPELASWCELTLTESRRSPRVTASPGDRPPFPALLTVPLRTVRDEFGTMAFALHSDDAASVARTLAARVALALDNQRLLTERSHIAETLQRSLLPSRLRVPATLEVGARYRAAGAQNLVGGDFFDFFQSGDNVWTAILGDISGKGPEAAAITALSRHTLRAGALRERSPKANLLLLNEALLSATDRDWRFATVVYVRVCPDDRGAAVMVSTGGHLPPMVRRADGTIEHVPVQGTLLGSVAEPTLDDHELRLAPGDLLLLYTDGVTEVRPQQPSWGDDLLARTVAAHGDGTPQELVDAVGRAAVDAQEGEPRDDIALLAVRAAL